MGNKSLKPKLPYLSDQDERNPTRSWQTWAKVIEMRQLFPENSLLHCHTVNSRVQRAVEGPPHVVCKVQAACVCEESSRGRGQPLWRKSSNWTVILQSVGQSCLGNDLAVGNSAYQNMVVWSVSCLPCIFWKASGIGLRLSRSFEMTELLYF